MPNTNEYKYRNAVQKFDIAIYLLRDGSPDYTTAAVYYIEQALIKYANSIENQFGSTAEVEVEDLDSALRRLRDWDAVRTIKHYGNLPTWLINVRNLVTEADARRAVVTLAAQAYELIHDSTLNAKGDLKERFITIKAHIENMQG